jgi:hypothetical protein
MDPMVTTPVKSPCDMASDPFCDATHFPDMEGFCMLWGGRHAWMCGTIHGPAPCIGRCCIFMPPDPPPSANPEMITDAGSGVSCCAQ